MIHIFVRQNSNQKYKNTKHMNSSSQLISHDNLSDPKFDHPDKIIIQKVVEAIAQGQQIINDKSGGAEHIVLFWGFSGTGKSTGVILLSGQQVLGYHHGNPILVQKNPTEAQKGVKIEISVQGGTIYPAFLELKRKDTARERVMLWDIPGLGQNRGITQSMINSYFIHRIFSFHKQIKLFFTINYSNIEQSGKAADFSKVIDEMTKILGHFDRYSQGVALMITKVPQYSDKKDILNCFTQISALPSIKHNTKFKQFLHLVIAQKIPIIIVKKPLLRKNGKVSRQEAQDVTNQYQQLIDQTYQIVINDLKSVSFPKLPSTAMSKTQQERCKPLFQSTLNLIQQQIKKITQNLKRFIINPYSQVVFSSDVEKVKQLLTRCNQMTKFVFQTIRITEKQKDNRSREDLKNRFDNLKCLFESANYLVQTNNGKPFCTPMVSFNDQYIMTKFLNTIQLNTAEIKFKWKDQSQLIIELFSKIQELHLKQTWQKQEKQVHQNLKTYIRFYFEKQFVGEIQKQMLYRSWSEQFRIFPSFISTTTIYSDHKESIPYFNELRNKSSLCQIKASNNLDSLIKILELNKKNMQKEPDEQFIQKEIKTRLESKGKNLIEIITSEKQNKRQTNQVIQKYSVKTSEQSGKLQLKIKYLQEQVKILKSQNSFHYNEESLVFIYLLFNLLKIKRNNSFFLSFTRLKDDIQSEQKCCFCCFYKKKKKN